MPIADTQKFLRAVYHNNNVAPKSPFIEGGMAYEMGFCRDVNPYSKDPHHPDECDYADFESTIKGKTTMKRIQLYILDPLYPRILGKTSLSAVTGIDADYPPELVVSAKISRALIKAGVFAPAS